LHSEITVESQSFAIAMMTLNSDIKVELEQILRSDETILSIRSPPHHQQYIEELAAEDLTLPRQRSLAEETQKIDLDRSHATDHDYIPCKNSKSEINDSLGVQVSSLIKQADELQLEVKDLRKSREEQHQQDNAVIVALHECLKRSELERDKYALAAKKALERVEILTHERGIQEKKLIDLSESGTKYQLEISRLRRELNDEKFR